MNREKAINSLVKITILLSRIRNSVKDKFFLSKLSARIYSFVSAFIIFLSSSGDSVAQRELSQKLITATDNILETFEYLEHLNILRLSPLSLRVSKELLSVKLYLLQEIEKPNPAEPRKEVPVVQKISENQTKNNFKLNQSKQKILNFIRSFPNTRTKDIIQEFNVLSDRTVKRNLTELLHSGVIQKRVDNKAVYYYASE
jgi:hypothetical protein